MTVTDRTGMLLTVAGLPPGALRGRRADPATLSFTGSGGSWTVSGRRSAKATLTVALALDEGVAGKAFQVLNGGTIRTGGRNAAAEFAIPDAGVAGRDWFGCVWSKLAA